VIVELIPAGNPSEWTGPTGNNTWLVQGREPALVDAGVGRPAHIDRISAALNGAPLATILITHGHSDHVAGLDALRERWPGVLVVRHPVDAETVRAGDGELEIIPTPGHAPDHLCFFDRRSGDLFCGDLARLGGTVVIPAHTGGDLRAYLASLRRVRDLAPARLLPGHGPIVDDPATLLDQYLVHRAYRERQIVDAMRAGAKTAEEIVDRVYPGISAALRPAALETIEAHLAKLRTDPPAH
jgi:glyoxylase-like metal-dependent hydrolase (beta-lactamase superfamily II)